jgi:hypothetical protein
MRFACRKYSDSQSGALPYGFQASRPLGFRTKKSFHMKPAKKQRTSKRENIASRLSRCQELNNYTCSDVSMWVCGDEGGQARGHSSGAEEPSHKFPAKASVLSYRPMSFHIACCDPSQPGNKISKFNVAFLVPWTYSRGNGGAL